jgi:uncharacterized iron-regulated membrane protein
MENATSSVQEVTAVLESPSNRFYRSIWRWHFYAGLFVIPFMVILAISGSIYLFKPQLDTLMYRNLIMVQPTGAIVPYTQQLQAAENAYPNASVTKFIPNAAIDRSSEVDLTTADQQNLQVFVNPYTGKVLGNLNADRNLQAIVRKIHGELMLGTVGDYLVELAACWGLVLLLTGLYLWLPRRGFSVWGTLLPRLGSKNQRIFWRDLHAVPGLYAVLLIGFLILTGLPWSGFWGDTFAKVWGRFPAHMFDDIPQSTILTGSLNQHGAQVVPWAVEQMPMPLSGADAKPGAHAQHQMQETMPHTSAASSPVTLDSVVALAQVSGAPAGFTVSFPEGETGVYTVSASPDNPAHETTLHIDRYSGKVLADVRWQDYGLVPKAVEMGIAIHMGKYFGLANQLLMLLVCLAIVLLSLSGIVLWWQRRPAGQIGAPALPSYAQSWKMPVAIVAVLGVAFPLVGISLIAVLLLDYLVISRIPLLRRILN